MSCFTLCLQGATQYERMDDIISFVAEDASGSFGLKKGHAQFITTLVFGLARFCHADGRWEYLALPGAVICFENNFLTLSTRRFLRSDDVVQISEALTQDLVVEEQQLAGLKHSLKQMEMAMMQRLWRAGKFEEMGR